ncbi:serine/threonine protein phosphatase 1 [Rhizobium sp. PP-F2F-G36]|nr:serine/threonine protein phosphatase 1 [Rhizobium sp. PP-F2F-G36]
MNNHYDIHTFAIGDVHGRADLLETMLGHIAFHVSDEGIRHRIVFLGDIIDKGPDSRRAMELVIKTVADVPGSKLVLGNHDALPLEILDEADPGRAKMRLDHWVRNQGGDATLSSYGIDYHRLTPSKLRDRLDPKLVAFLRNAEPYVELEHHLLVHGGLRPGIPLDQQNRREIMWIREPFLSFLGSFGKTVVHGHTPTDSGRPEQFGSRLCIDTGAYSSGNLTVAHIAPDGAVDLMWTKAMASTEVETVVALVDGGISSERSKILE